MALSQFVCFLSNGEARVCLIRSLVVTLCINWLTKWLPLSVMISSGTPCLAMTLMIALTVSSPVGALRKDSTSGNFVKSSWMVSFALASWTSVDMLAKVAIHPWPVELSRHALVSPLNCQMASQEVLMVQLHGL
ncbi:unnamed protein product [Vitrella brassicaformis CCMP3155]|uniref:Uncharacterized protein n=1 Tax=Vitrella brassicaformis (strain CCMP3155) TaxID=1169540 RepID=A0A0G4H305_VITBC|nr:unnamed protein product [Vitrella brassicaformis CCMP3155]|eukprot:CEM38062.1 unnamed protein product [Vitrella brassicaformis CCMP3155]